MQYLESIGLGNNAREQNDAAGDLKLFTITSLITNVFSKYAKIGIATTTMNAFDEYNANQKDRKRESFAADVTEYFSFIELDRLGVDDATMLSKMLPDYLQVLILFTFLLYV